MSKSWRCSLLAAALLSGCLQEFETPSAFEDEAFLCGTQAFDERVAACRAARAERGACGGVISLQGRPQGTDVVATVDMTTSISRVDETTDVSILAGAEGTGAAPYFFLSLKIKSIGGEATAVPTSVTRVMAFDTAAEGRAAPLGDDAVDVGLRISNGAESMDLAGLTGMGSVTITSQGRDELAGTFEGSFAEPEDVVEGCFHMLALDVRITR